MQNKNLILFVVIAFVISSIYYLESQKITVSSSNSIPLELIGSFPKAPELQGISGYLNTDNPIKISDYKGKVVLIDFWTYSCINCIRTLPHLTAWHEKYKNEGLVIIGVHTPEFEFEKDKNNVQTALEKYNINYVVVQDNDYATWRAFQNRYWPRKYLIDKDGLIRYDHIGEGGYVETETKIQQLLLEIKPDLLKRNLTNLPDITPQKTQTPELYAGYEFTLPRGQNIGNDGGLQSGIVDYSFDGALVHNKIFLKGLWQSNQDNLEAKGPASIFLGYTSSAVNIVADNIATDNTMTDNTMTDNIIANNREIEIWLNGERITAKNAGDAVEKSIVKVTKPDLYNVVRSNYGTYVLEIKVTTGFAFNAFTFG